jgi:hypothetical protein
MRQTDYNGPYRFPFIALLTRTEKIRGVRVTLTAKLVIRSEFSNV